MDLQQTKPMRRRWYEVTPFAAAFFAGLALAMMTFPVLQSVGGRAAVDRWGLPIALIGALAAGQWGQRLPRRLLVVAMILFWLIEFWLITHAA